MATTYSEDGTKKVRKNTNRGLVAQKFENPGDGSIPARYPGESLREYRIRRNQGLKDRMEG